MAKKKTARKPKTLSEAVGFQNIFNSEKTDFFLGVLTIVLAVYFIIAMISYFNTGCTDQSILEDMRPGEWLNTNQEFANYCGSVGAIISYFFIAQNFGIPAFLIPIYMILAALKLMKAYTINLWKWFFGMMLTMIWCSVTFAKFLSPILGDQVYNAGGNHGLFIVQTLENLIGPPGLTLILLVTALAFLTYLTSETITIVRKLLNPIGYISNKVKFTITTHHDNDKDPIYEEPDESIEPEDAKDFNDPEPSPVIDLDELEKKNFTTLFITGNHENYDRLRTYPDKEWHGGVVKEIRPSVLLLKRGYVFDIDGFKCFAMGGARSHDIWGGVFDLDDPDYHKKIARAKRAYEPFRINHLSWWKEEIPSEEEQKRALDNLEANNWKVDYVFTHEAPASDVRSIDWMYKPDEYSKFLEGIKQSLDYKHWFFGHYHENRHIGEKGHVLYEQIIKLY